jgi:type I restriction enzyme, S subunit
MPSTLSNNSLQTPRADWSLVRLGDFTTKIGSGSTPRGGEAVYVKKGVPFIRSMNVHFDGLRPEGLAFITKVEAEKLKNVTVQEGDVLLNITGASIGRVTTVPGELAGARVNQHVCIIRPTAALIRSFSPTSLRRLSNR